MIRHLSKSREDQVTYEWRQSWPSATPASWACPGDDKRMSSAQRVHPAFDACTELLHYSHRTALQLILSPIDLALDALFFFEQISEIFKMWALRCSPVGNASVSVTCCCHKRERIQVLLVGLLFTLSLTAQCSITIILCLAEASLDAPTAGLDLWQWRVSLSKGSKHQ